MDPEHAFGAVLRELRLGRGLSQERLALEADLQRNYISLLEHGVSAASIRTLFKLALVFSLAVSEIMARTEPRLTTPARRKRRD